KTIKEMQKNAAFMDPSRLAAYAGVAQADAWKAAASNTSAGPMMAFMGMNAAQNAAGGMDINGLLAQGQQMRQQQAQAAPAQDAWKCSCGATVTGNFCPECGAKKPAPAAGWTCSCGTVNQGKFCSNCGAKKPAGALQYKCDKCGWTPEDPANPPKFCPECGDPFGDEDVVQ
ncbi:MAG: SPFH domain-containing protein, partial [Lachnospiraceae bacterium]|nr:SPFH domain-containing protein [Lachnospiraceae bacterium]